MISRTFSAPSPLAFSPDELSLHLQQQPFAGHEGVRMLFVPPRLTAQNVAQLAWVYRQIGSTQYDTVVICEQGNRNASRKIALFGGSYAETPLGQVAFDEQLRDDFCDEEDDFFIDEQPDLLQSGFFDQLAMVQLTQKSFRVTGLQLNDDTPPIVEELTYVLREIMPTMNSLLVFCCSMPVAEHKEFDRLGKAVHAGNDTPLLHTVYGKRHRIDGAGVFLSGVLSARQRERQIRFGPAELARKAGNLLAGYAAFPD